MLKAQILAKLKSKFPGLSNEFLGFVADKLSGKITEESQIEGAIDELNNGTISLTDQAAFFQSESDRRVSDAKKKWEQDKNQKPPKAGTKKPKSGEDEDEDGDDPDSTLAQLKALQEKIEAFESKQKHQSLTEKLHQKLKEKGIPATIAKGRLPENEEGLEALVTEIETDYNEIKQGFVNQGLKEMSGAPVGGSATTESIKSDIDAWAAAGKAPEAK